jgi:hypothetical protein
MHTEGFIAEVILILIAKFALSQKFNTLTNQSLNAINAIAQCAEYFCPAISKCIVLVCNILHQILGNVLMLHNTNYYLI